ncbi:MAG: hypothetical protein LC798_02930 [Chloroflexi bacterium]|nr:hypothetical protein [Chloroflexota bacterium]
MTDLRSVGVDAEEFAAICGGLGTEGGGVMADGRAAELAVLMRHAADKLDARRDVWRATSLPRDDIAAMTMGATMLRVVALYIVDDQSSEAG